MLFHKGPQCISNASYCGTYVHSSVVIVLHFMQLCKYNSLTDFTVEYSHFVVCLLSCFSSHCYPPQHINPLVVEVGCLFPPE